MVDQTRINSQTIAFLRQRVDIAARAISNFLAGLKRAQPLQERTAEAQADGDDFAQDIEETLGCVDTFHHRDIDHEIPVDLYEERGGQLLCDALERVLNDEAAEVLDLYRAVISIGFKDAHLLDPHFDELTL